VGFVFTIEHRELNCLGDLIYCPEFVAAPMAGFSVLFPPIPATVPGVDKRVRAIVCDVQVPIADVVIHDIAILIE
jgi:hypothetical protein